MPAKKDTQAELEELEAEQADESEAKELEAISELSAEANKSEVRELTLLPPPFPISAKYYTYSRAQLVQEISTWDTPNKPKPTEADSITDAELVEYLAYLNNEGTLSTPVESRMSWDEYKDNRHG